MKQLPTGIRVAFCLALVWLIMGGQAATPSSALENPPPTPAQISAARLEMAAGNCSAVQNILKPYLADKTRDAYFEWEAAVMLESCPDAAGEKNPPKLPGAAAADAPPKINAVQVFVFASPDISQLEGELRLLKASGFDTIIVRAFHNLGDRPLLKNLTVNEPGVYFKSSIAPAAADILETVVRQAHALGLRVFAWMTTRRSDWLIAEHPEWLESQYDFALRRSIPSRSLSVFEGGVRQKLAGLFREMASCGIDGVLFQDDLIMRHTEGFSRLASELFLMESGKGVHPDDLYRGDDDGRGRAISYTPLFQEWSLWKTKTLLSFLQEMVASLRQVNPRLLVAVNAYYESLLRPDLGLAWYAQDLSRLPDHGADYVALMSYHRQIKSELGLPQNEVAATMARMPPLAFRLPLPPAQIIFKIQTVDWDSLQPIPEEEWREVADKFRQAGDFSLAVLRN